MHIISLVTGQLNTTLNPDINKSSSENLLNSGAILFTKNSPNFWADGSFRKPFILYGQDKGNSHMNIFTTNVP